MRFLSNYVGASLIAAIVAAIWVAWFGADQTITRSFGVPDFVGAISPSLAVSVRQILMFHAEIGIPTATVIDVLVGLPLFLVLNLAGLLLFSLVDGAWKGEPGWDKAKPLWAALIFTAATVLVVLVSRKYGLPPFDRLRVQLPGLAAATAVAGLLYGFGRMLREAAERR